MYINFDVEAGTLFHYLKKCKERSNHCSFFQDLFDLQQRMHVFLAAFVVRN
jgi:hypothetical protein